MDSNNFISFDISFDGELPIVSEWANKNTQAQYDYEYDELLSIKTQLNKKKSELDKYFAHPDTAKKYKKLSDEFYHFEDLRMSGQLRDIYNAQFVTKAWLKIYELVFTYVADELETIAHKKTNNNFYSFHVAEAPGAFLPSINHFIKTSYPNVQWHWFAESYRSLNEYSNGHYLGDTYGIIKKYSKNWIFGADGDGDITSPANIKWFAHKIRSSFGQLNLFTSDVKFVPSENFDYNEEEIYNLPVHIGHTIAALATLSKGGCAILKTFTFMQASSVSLLYLLAMCFEKIYITKPMTSTSSNSETYVVCRNYKANLTKLQFDALYAYLILVNGQYRSKMCLFKRETIPAQFVSKIADVMQKLTDRQIKFLDRNNTLFEKYKNEKMSTVLDELKNIRHSHAKEWISKYQIKKIKDSDKL